MNFFDWVNTTSAQGLLAFRSLMSFVVVVLAAVLPGRGGYTLVKVIAAGVLAAILLVFVWGGIEGIKESVAPLLPNYHG